MPPRPQSPPFAAAVRLPGEPRSPRQARQFLAETLDGMVEEDLCDTAVLLACELITNAVLHTDSPCELHVRGTPDRLRVTVMDEGEGLPMPRSPGPLAENGRGLDLLDAMATEWGCEPRSGGKAVWFELPLNDGMGDGS